MGVKPNVPGKPQVAVPQAAAPQPGAPSKPGPTLKSLRSRAPRIGGAQRRINESTVITVVIILIFLLIGGMSYMYLGQNNSSGVGTADAASVNGRDTVSGQSVNGPNGLVGNAQENRVGRENIGLAGDTSTTQRANVNGQTAYETNGVLGGAGGPNSRFRTGNNNGTNAQGVQGFITGENVVGGGSSGINRNYNLGMRQGVGLNQPGGGNGSGGRGANPNAHRPGFEAW
ncbi:MAG TPA: hypothetical protein VFA07_07815 [Chthonomonadaceae bacterium]|nr:hypothetical protein [Chthonomonadaceae bacterium]